MLLLFFGFGSKNVYETVKHSNSSAEDVDNANNNISRRFSHCNFNRGIDSGSRQSDISSTGFEFLDKQKEINFCSQVKT